MKVFLDTNILLDALAERSNPVFSKNAETIFALGENGVVDLYMSVLSIPTIAYVLKNKTAGQKRAIIKDLTSIIEPLPTFPEHIKNMLEQQMTDIEDALQVQSALEGQCDIIITRNLHDFRDSVIPAISPDDFLDRVLE